MTAEILVFETEATYRVDTTNDVADGVLVFDADPPAQAVSGDLDSGEVLVFEPELLEVRTIQQDSGVIISEVELPPSVLSLPELDDVVVITSAGTPGLPGDPGGPGPRGIQGERGPAGYGLTEYTYGFAIPSTEWVISHDLNVRSLVIETDDQTGQPLEGSVRYIDADTVAIDWYYPTAGTARIYR